MIKAFEVLCWALLAVSVTFLVLDVVLRAEDPLWIWHVITFAAGAFIGATGIYAARTS